MAALTFRAFAQAEANPRYALPERPTIADHAYAVAPGYAEVEAGGEWDHPPYATNSLNVPILLKIGLAPHIQLGIQQDFLRVPGFSSRFGDLNLQGKFCIGHALPIMGNAAVLAGLKLPTGPEPQGTGTTDTDFLLISSHHFGEVELDVNLGYTRRSGDGSEVPKDATLVDAAWSLPVSGPLEFDLETFLYPGTSGPAGSRPILALLGGPDYRIAPCCVLDMGGIFRLSGPQPNAFYAGVTYNLGRLIP